MGVEEEKTTMLSYGNRNKNKKQDLDDPRKRMNEAMELLDEINEKRVIVTDLYAMARQLQDKIDEAVNLGLEVHFKVSMLAEQATVKTIRSISFERCVENRVYS